MRILHTLMSKSIAGTERYVSDLCNYQSKMHDVAILVRNDLPANPELSFLSWLSPDVTILKAHRKLLYPCILWHIVRWRPDIIHSHHKRDAKYLGLFTFRTPKVATLHIRYTKAFKNFDALITIASWQTRDIPYRQKRILETIYNWVPVSTNKGNKKASPRAKLGIPAESYVIGSVGRFVREKGFNILINAFKQANLSDAYLVLVGDGPERKKLLRLNGDRRIILPGSSNRISEYYELFDLFVLPSLFEPFGLVLLEAMQYKLPIISTNLDGPKEILTNDSVSFVAPDNTKQLAAALVNVYHSKLKKPISYDLRRFTRQTQADKIEKLYRKVLENYHL